jgi:hypothetical protein
MTAALPPPPTRPSPPTLADRLRQLDELHTSGLITDDEYAAKRQSMLDTI